MSSVVGIHPGGSSSGSCPFLKIVIGEPASPSSDQLFVISASILDVLPNLILLPNLLSMILSPAKGIIECIF